MIAERVAASADVFTDLVELQSKLGRDPSERPRPRANRVITRRNSCSARPPRCRGGDDDDFDDLKTIRRPASRLRFSVPNPTAIARSVPRLAGFREGGRAHANRSCSILRCPRSAIPTGGY